MAPAYLTKLFGTTRTQHNAEIFPHEPAERSQKVTQFLLETTVSVMEIQNYGTSCLWTLDLVQVLVVFSNLLKHIFFQQNYGLEWCHFNNWTNMNWFWYIMYGMWSSWEPVDVGTLYMDVIITIVLTYRWGPVDVGTLYMDGIITIVLIYTDLR